MFFSFKTIINTALLISVTCGIQNSFAGQVSPVPVEVCGLSLPYFDQDGLFVAQLREGFETSSQEVNSITPFKHYRINGYRNLDSSNYRNELEYELAISDLLSILQRSVIRICITGDLERKKRGSREFFYLYPKKYELREKRENVLLLSDLIGRLASNEFETELSADLSSTHGNATLSIHLNPKETEALDLMNCSNLAADANQKSLKIPLELSFKEKANIVATAKIKCLTNSKIQDLFLSIDFRKKQTLINATLQISKTANSKPVSVFKLQKLR